MNTAAKRSTDLRHSRVGSVVLAPDFVASVPLSIGVGFLVHHFDAVASAAAAVLLTYAAGLIGLTAFVITAHTLVISLMSREYLEILQRAKGAVPGVSRPYKIVTWVCAWGALSAFIATLVWPISGDVFDAARPVVLALPTFMASWGILGAAHLIGLGAFHLENHASLLEIIQDYRTAKNQQSVKDTASSQHSDP